MGRDQQEIREMIEVHERSEIETNSPEYRCFVPRIKILTSCR